MSRDCPNCHHQIPSRGLVVRRGRALGTSWFRYSAARFYCPQCRAPLKPKSLPFGYVFEFLVVPVLGAGIILAYSVLPGSWKFVGALCCEKWGFKLLLNDHGREE
jgi:hypothetical protein